MGTINDAIAKTGKVPAERPCPACKDSNGKCWDGKDACYYCKGTLKFSVPDFDAIIENIKGRKGLRSKRPDDKRSYYVWRLARFHGGLDVTLPMGAMMDLHNDPYRPELDEVAEAVARKALGTDMAAAYRWGSALGFSGPAPEGLPATAYPCGPAATVPKPPEERLELEG